MTIKNWTTVKHLSYHDDIILVISKTINDLPKTLFEQSSTMSSRTILISEQFSPVTINRLLKRNLSSFIDYNDLTTDVLDTALKACSMGNLFISKSILNLYKSVPYTEEIFTLSKRELEIIKLIGEELTTKEIASELYLSKRTVDTHRQNVMKKLNVKNNVGLIKTAILNNLIYNYLALMASYIKATLIQQHEQKE